MNASLNRLVNYKFMRIPEMVEKLSGGDPNAMVVLYNLTRIDPSCGGLKYLFALDILGIYGADIVKDYKDCNKFVDAFNDLLAAKGSSSKACETMTLAYYNR